MALYFIEYDLRQPQRNYQPLYDELVRLSAIRILKSLWCLQHFDTDVTRLRDHFKGYLDADDGLCVSEVSNWATYNTEGSPNKLP